MQITVESHPPQDKLDELHVAEWPIWEKEASSFPWYYDMEEVCYLLDGSVTVTPEGGEPVHIRAGDLVTFPLGMSCQWDIHHPVRKYYNFR
ncbi:MULTISPECIES: cupin domain-containing protein [Thiomicrorhabdus]|uniref:Cupin domain-containing protein n=1 Tax=Thiomicrorhabdus heinhorstiae TaxID=2748010 RepID=A0ABS0BYF3_9GAMM|nr:MULTISPECIES: cupin domain-containing protein [Thiomicrorhabdus]MBF6056986.1 cupin domain-containing protein [Thiomicrorhabdus heinhorstiae]